MASNESGISTSHPVSVSVDQTLAMVQFNGWLGAAALDKVRADIQKMPGADGRALHAHLVDANLLTKDQGNDLKALVQHQATLSQFTFLKKLGSGGMGTVFLVREGLAENSRLLALKTINARLSGYDDFLGRFKRETTALEGVAHPNIAGVIKSGESHGVCYLAMEYIEGPSLANLQSDAKALPETYVLEIVRQIAAGLGHVWDSAQLVHRDIKPENILIVRAKDLIEKFPLSDVAKLIDFGLVKHSNEQDDLRLTQTGMTIGTPLYMSPEQIRGEELDCRSDIYGLASTMFHLLTGITPFTGTSPGAIMSAHLTQPAPDPGDRVPSLHPSTRRLVMTGMAKKASDRFANHAAFIHAIELAQQELAGRNTSQIKLLRKPMVLKSPLRKPGEPQPAPVPATPTAADKPSGSATTRRNIPVVGIQDHEHLTARIVQKHRQAAAGEAGMDAASGHKAGMLRAITDQLPIPDGPIARTASELLHQVHTEKHNHKHHHDQGTEAADMVISSSIYHEDPNRTVGMGVMPWLVLGGAVLLLAAYLVMSFMGIVG